MNFSARDKTAIIYYFFNSSMKESLKVSTFLRCILHQAIRVEDLIPTFQRRLESLFLDLMSQPEPATSELEELFLYFYEKFKNGFLLVDGLDEADEVDQRNIKSFLKNVQKVDSARILVVTHAAMDMLRIFPHASVLQIKPEYLEDDIEVFIQSQIDQHSKGELSNCSPSMLNIIKRKLVSDAEGMLVTNWRILT